MYVLQVSGLRKNTNSSPYDLINTFYSIYHSQDVCEHTYRIILSLSPHPTPITSNTETLETR